jgi:hypothetical protein
MCCCFLERSFWLKIVRVIKQHRIYGRRGDRILREGRGDHWLLCLLLNFLVHLTEYCHDSLHLML